MRVGKEMTRKVQKVDDESDEDVPAVQPEKSDNPWLGGGSSGSTTEAQEITSGYRKLWNAVNEGTKARKDMKNSEEQNDEESDSSESEAEEGEADEDAHEESVEAEEMKTKFSEELDEDLVQKKTIEDFASAVQTKKRKRPEPKVPTCKAAPVAELKTEVEKEKKERVSTDIDPNKFVTMTNAVVLKSSVPSTEEGGDEEDEEEQAASERRMTLAEAFAEDDVVDQFREEKKKIVDANAPKDIDLTLPGWGEWGGSGLKVSRRKKKLFLIKAPPAPKRRDDNQGNLILNEDKCPAMRRQKVLCHTLFCVLCPANDLLIDR